MPHSTLTDLFDKYGRTARLFPALLCLPPYLLIDQDVLSKYFPATITSGIFVTLGDVSLSVVLLYLLVQVNRMVSKLLFEDRRAFPTTQALMPGGAGLSDQYRSRIALKVNADFRLSLPDTHAVALDREAAEQRCAEIGSQIVNRVAKGRLLYQHNIEYGFVRNLLGGCVLSFAVSCVAACAFRWVVPDHARLIFSLALATAYFIPLLFSRWILGYFSRAYAHILFREYVGDGLV